MSDRLKEIAERAEKATPGPWKKTGPWFPAEPKTRQLPDVYSNVQTTEGSIADCWPWTDHGANAEFIAAAREDVPFLLAELQKRDQEIERLNKREAALALWWSNSVSNPIGKWNPDEMTVRMWLDQCIAVFSQRQIEANKLLEQTIEVLEGWQPNWRWHDEQAKPLLDNLKAREK